MEWACSVALVGRSPGKQEGPISRKLPTLTENQGNANFIKFSFFGGKGPTKWVNILLNIWSQCGWAYSRINTPLKEMSFAVTFWKTNVWAFWLSHLLRVYNNTEAAKKIMCPESLWSFADFTWNLGTPWILIARVSDYNVPFSNSVTTATIFSGKSSHYLKGTQHGSYYTMELQFCAQCLYPK